METHIDTRLQYALERRFGASLMPYVASEIGGGIRRLSDTESGSWVEGTLSRGRLVVTASHDGAAS